jgi:hypothetical protein
MMPTKPPVEKPRDDLDLASSAIPSDADNLLALVSLLPSSSRHHARIVEKYSGGAWIGVLPYQALEFPIHWYRSKGLIAYPGWEDGGAAEARS